MTRSEGAGLSSTGGEMARPRENGVRAFARGRETAKILSRRGACVGCGYLERWVA